MWERQDALWNLGGNHRAFCFLWYSCSMTLRLQTLDDLMGIASADVLELNGIAIALPERTVQTQQLSKESHLERNFRLLWDSMKLPTLTSEHRFHPTRRWRFDFAHISTKIAIEIEGVVYRGKSRHRTASGFEGDLEKYFAALVEGWIVVRLGPKMIDREHLEGISELIGQRRECAEGLHCPD